MDGKMCTGCMACGDICPVGALVFRLDQKGFWYPKINSKKCIGCKKCKEVCPQIALPSLYRQKPICYSAWNKNREERLESTSGGLFSVFAKAIIREGGRVVGCRYRGDYKSVKHGLASSSDEIRLFRGSKYVQSDTKGIYSKIKSELHNGRRVLFSGLPCQVSALYKYLGEDSENLITIDFICHGINSPKAYAAYVSEKERKKKSEVSLVQMKNKILGWKSLATYMRFSNGSELLHDRARDLWIRGYIMYNLYHRESCFHCRYRKIPREADITLGDYWGIKRVSKRELHDGVSVVLINSKKGNKLFQNIHNDIVYKEGDWREILKNNPALVEDAKVYNGREVFFFLMEKTTFSFAYWIAQAVNFIEINRLAGWRKKGFFVMNHDCVMLNTVWKRIRKEKVFQIIESLNEGKINLYEFFHYNYFSDNVLREDGSFVIPYKGAVIQLDKSARIYIKKGNLHIGIAQFPKTKRETYLKIKSGGRWEATGGCVLYENTTIEITERAVLETGYFTANIGSVIVCAKKIRFGRDVMLARNVIIYDSDHHQIIKNGRVTNEAKEVNIDEHVWLGANVIVLKGVHIGKGAVVGAGAVVCKDISAGFVNTGSREILKYGKERTWSRKNTRFLP